MNKSFFDYFGLIITSIGTLLGFVGLYLTINSTVAISQLLNNLTISLVVLSVILFFLFLVFLRQFLIHYRYTNCYTIISEAFSISHKLRDSNEIHDLRQTIPALQEFCTYISKAFNKFTSKNVSVCIKLFHITSKGDITVKTFCRDRDSHENKNRIKPEHDDCVHFISENTDFKYIFENVNNTGIEYRYYM